MLNAVKCLDCEHFFTNCTMGMKTIPCGRNRRSSPCITWTCPASCRLLTACSRCDIAVGVSDIISDNMHSVRSVQTWIRICKRQTFLSKYLPEPLHSTLRIQSSTGTVFLHFSYCKYFRKNKLPAKNIVCKYHKSHVPMASMHIQKDKYSQVQNVLVKWLPFWIKRL